MKAPLDLVLLTAEYPFGNKAETFLEAEIEVLGARFRRVFVLPSHPGTGRRPMPENATLVEMPWLDAADKSRPSSRPNWRELLNSEAKRSGYHARNRTETGSAIEDFETSVTVGMEDDFEVGLALE